MNEELNFTKPIVHQYAQLNFDKKMAARYPIPQSMIHAAAGRGEFSIDISPESVSAEYLNWLSDKGFYIYGKVKTDKTDKGFRNLPSLVDLTNIETVQIRW